MKAKSIFERVCELADNPKLARETAERIARELPAARALMREGSALFADAELDSIDQAEDKLSTDLDNAAQRRRLGLS